MPNYPDDDFGDIDPMSNPAVPEHVWNPPAGSEEAYEYISELLKEGCEDCGCVVAELCDDVGGQLAECAAEVSSACRSILGGAAALTDQALQAIRKVADKILKDTSDQILSAASELSVNGVNYPYDVDLQRALLASDPSDWLPLAIPAIQAYYSPPAAEQKTTDALLNTGTNGGGVVTLPPPPFTGPPVFPPPPPPGGGFLPGECPPCPETATGGETVPPPLGTCPPPVVQCPTIPPFPPYPPPPALPPITVTVNGQSVVIGPPGSVPIPVPVPQPQPQPQPQPGGQVGSPIPPEPPPEPEPIPVPIPVPVDPPETAPPPREKIIVDVPAPKAGKLDTIPALAWDCPNPCPAVFAEIGRIEGKGQDADKTKAQILKEIAGWQNSTFGWLFDKAVEFKNGFEAIAEMISNAITFGPTAALAQGTAVLVSAFNAINPAANPFPKAGAYFAAKIGIANWAERQTGAPVSYMYQSDVYTYQAANPQYVISQPSIHMAYHAGLIDHATWDCLTRAHGNQPCWFEKERELVRPKLNIEEVIAARRRGIINDTDDWQLYSGRAGWASESDRVLKYLLSEQLPTQTDLLRFMVRDSADPDVVAKYNYDKDFGKKFTGQIRKWFEAQGVPEEVALFFWRAHWQIPSYTQLTEMLHRFRPDRPEVTAYLEAIAIHGEEGAAALLGQPPIVVTINDVRQALEINDFAPAWVDGMIGISYHPLTRTDAVRAYEIGSITADQLHGVMRDNGYNEPDAKTLTKFYTQQKARRQANATGVLTVRKIVKLYKEDALTRLAAEEAIAPLVTNPQEAARLLDNAQLEATAEHNRTLIKLAKKLFLRGAATDAETESALAAAEVQADRIAVLVRRWRDERRLTEREVTAAQLCKWFKLRLITEDQYRSRLIGLRFDLEDVERIIKQCRSGR